MTHNFSGDVLEKPALNTSILTGAVLLPARRYFTAKDNI